MLIAEGTMPEIRCYSCGRTEAEVLETISGAYRATLERARQRRESTAADAADRAEQQLAETKSLVTRIEELPDIVRRFKLFTLKAEKQTLPTDWPLDAVFSVFHRHRGDFAGDPTLEDIRDYLQSTIDSRVEETAGRNTGVSGTEQEWMIDRALEHLKESGLLQPVPIPDLFRLRRDPTFRIPTVTKFLKTHTKDVGFDQAWAVIRLFAQLFGSFDQARKTSNSREQIQPLIEEAVMNESGLSDAARSLCTVKAYQSMQRELSQVPTDPAELRISLHNPPSGTVMRCVICQGYHDEAMRSPVPQ
jgi:hypothetical protein